MLNNILRGDLQQRVFYIALSPPKWLLVKLFVIATEINRAVSKYFLYKPEGQSLDPLTYMGASYGATDLQLWHCGCLQSQTATMGLLVSQDN